MIVPFNKFMSIRSALDEYTMALNINWSSISKKYLIDRKLVKNTDEASSITDYGKNIKFNKFIIPKIIFFRYDSFNTYWGNDKGILEMFPYRSQRNRWVHFKDYYRKYIID